MPTLAFATLDLKSREEEGGTPDRDIRTQHQLLGCQIFCGKRNVG